MSPIAQHWPADRTVVELGAAKAQQAGVASVMRAASCMAPQPLTLLPSLGHWQTATVSEAAGLLQLIHAAPVAWRSHARLAANGWPTPAAPAAPAMLQTTGA